MGDTTLFTLTLWDNTAIYTKVNEGDQMNYVMWNLLQEMET